MDEGKDGDEGALPADANETIYVKNLNERVKLDGEWRRVEGEDAACHSLTHLAALPVLKKSLESLFSTYGTVLSVTAHSNVRMRGQAFVAFDSKEPAAKAVSEVVGFPLYGKPMVSDEGNTSGSAQY